MTQLRNSPPAVKPVTLTSSPVPLESFRYLTAHALLPVNMPCWLAEGSRMQSFISSTQTLTQAVSTAAASLIPSAQILYCATVCYTLTCIHTE